MQSIDNSEQNNVIVTCAVHLGSARIVGGRHAFNVHDGEKIKKQAKERTNEREPHIAGSDRRLFRAGRSAKVKSASKHLPFKDALLYARALKLPNTTCQPSFDPRKGLQARWAARARALAHPYSMSYAEVRNLRVVLE